MKTNYLCTECENIDELSNFIEPVKDGYYYTATCNKCNNRTHILKEYKMTRHEIEEQLKQFNTMVNDPKAFKPNCLCKFTWEDKHGEDIYIFIHNAKSHEELIGKIKAHMFIRNIDSSPESDLIINY